MSIRLGISAIFGVGALALVAALGACAESDDSFDPNIEDGGNNPPPGDGGVADAKSNDDADAADGARLACSTGGWCHTELPANVTLTGVWGDGTGVVWAISSKGSVLRWESDAWKVHATDLGALRAIWGSGPTDIWLGGERGILHGAGASSAAVAFTAVTTPGDETIPITSIWGAGPTDIWAVGGSTEVFPFVHRVLHYAPGDGGAAWSLEPIFAAPAAVNQVWGTATSGVWFAMEYFDDVESFTRGILYRRPVGASDFEPVTLPLDPGLGHVSSVSATATTIMLVGRAETTEVTTWHALTSDNGVTFDWTALRNSTPGDFSLNAVADLGPNDGWSAGEFGRLRHWDGVTWTQAPLTLTGIPLTNVFFGMWSQPSKEIWAVGERVALRRNLSK